MPNMNRVVAIIAVLTAAACAKQSSRTASTPPTRPTTAVALAEQRGPVRSVGAAVSLASPPSSAIAATGWSSLVVEVARVETGELVDLATAQNNVCGLYASGLAVCVDVVSRARTVVFAANPALQLRGPLKLRVANQLLCVESVWSVMCRSINSSAPSNQRVAEVRVPRGEWILDSVRGVVCTITTCVSVNTAAPASSAVLMFSSAVLPEAGPLRRSLVTTASRWALDQCPMQNGRGCLWCEGSGMCAKWRKALDIMRTPPKMPRRTTCVNGPNQVERCPPEPRARPIVMSDAAKRALIEKAWPTTEGTVAFGLVAELPDLGGRRRLVGSESAMCVVDPDDAFCATATTAPHSVARLPDWSNRNTAPVFVWATRLCALSRRDFRVTCSEIDLPSSAAVTVNLPSTTQLEKYTGIIAASNQRLCFSDPLGSVTCLTPDGAAPITIDATTLRGADGTSNLAVATADAARAKRSVSSARYFGDRFVTVNGPYLCRGDACQHAVTAVRVNRDDIPKQSPLVLSPRATQEFAQYEKRPIDNGAYACAPPVPKREDASVLERLADLSLPTVPLGRGGNWRCTNGTDAGFDVEVPTSWSRVIWWGNAACHATSSMLSCLPIREGGRTIHTVHVGFEIFAIDASSELLCVSAETVATPPICWRLDPSVGSFSPQLVTVPATLLAAPPARIR